MKTLILGGGLAGLATSYHFGHENCLILEKASGPFGHIHSEYKDGFTWDQGPHVSFTKDEYVRSLFAESVEQQFEEYAVRTRNYFQGHWIDHPAQSNLWQVPEPLRTQCLTSFLDARNEKSPENVPNYEAWLAYAFGRKFSEVFASAYTRKYWVTDPSQLATDWIGKRVFFPSVEDVRLGAQAPLERQTHYVTHVRYPSVGGYQRFAEKMFREARCRFHCEVRAIDLDERVVHATDRDGKDSAITYDRLVNTMPLPDFVRRCIGVPDRVAQAVEELVCSELLLVNVAAPHETKVDGNWFYIYDEDLYSTRINFTEKLSPRNAPEGWSGIQVEVYAHPKKGFPESADVIASKVVGECAKMGFIDPDLVESDVPSGSTGLRYHYRKVPYANVVCNLQRRAALDEILGWLEQHGLAREEDDLAAFTDWEKVKQRSFERLAHVGRFAQWKYFWTDDCVLSAERLSR